MKKSISPEERIIKYSGEIEKEIKRWIDIKDNGCSDPTWQDGSNMNLVRNHILHYKKMIRELCEENSIELPVIMYVATPPEVSNAYMADTKSKRALKLKKFQKIEHHKVEYDEGQFSFF